MGRAAPGSGSGPFEPPVLASEAGQRLLLFAADMTDVTVLPCAGAGVSAELSSPVLASHLRGHHQWMVSISPPLSPTSWPFPLSFCRCQICPFPSPAGQGSPAAVLPTAHFLLSAAPVPAWQPESLEMSHLLPRGTFQPQPPHPSSHLFFHV